MTIRLFCLPYAGASATVYGRWRRSLPGIEVHPVELPGRGRRFGEALPEDIPKLARQLALEIGDGLGWRYALFGHSLGALVAFEMAHALRALHLSPPMALFASGTAAPSRRDDRRFAGEKSDADLVATMRELNGTPEEVLADEELMRLALPVLRADLVMCGRYRHTPRPPLACPIHVLGGRDDGATDEQLDAWRQEGAGEFRRSMFDGGHFFLHGQETAVLSLIRDALLRDRAMPASAAG